MKIVADIDIPFLADAVKRCWPDVQIYSMKSEEIDHSAILDADVLLVRTRTLVNESLLKGTRVKMVCTATIGFDHIDTVYCENHGIQWISCPGCNAQAVCDYIEEALDEIGPRQTIGIVGVGHVGVLVAQMAKKRGYKVLLNDPPKGIGVPLNEIAEKCDIITFHTPLDKSTYHLCNEAFLKRCKSEAVIINAARGGVVDEQALLASGLTYILDTWEGEPCINHQVLQKAYLASMHIAGYSLQGKANATQMCLNAIARAFLLPNISLEYPSKSGEKDIKGDSEPGWLRRISNQLKDHPEAFEQLRKEYPLR